MSLQKCNGCGLYHHDLEDGLCTSCNYRKTHHVCNECGVYLLEEGDICPHIENGLEETIRNKKEKDEWIREEFPVVDKYGEHFDAIAHYYGNSYEHIGPAQEYYNKLRMYVDEHNLPHKAVDDLIGLYHAMFGC